MRTALPSVLLLLSAVGLGACSDAPAGDGRPVGSPGTVPHTHDTFVGDGTGASAGGYTLDRLRFPRSPDEPGELSFRVLGPGGEPVLDYVEQQTQLLHLYVVRADLGGLRHLHPALGEDGRWTARVNPGPPGAYRVVADFVPGGASGEHVVLGGQVTVAGTPPAEAAVPGSSNGDGVVTVDVPRTIRGGSDVHVDLTVSESGGGTPELGTYLGTSAHLTGFDVATGAMTHAHPVDAPVATDDGAVLTVSTDLVDLGPHRLFVQVRVDGFLHTVALTTTVV